LTPLFIRTLPATTNGLATIFLGRPKKRTMLDSLLFDGPAYEVESQAVCFIAQGSVSIGYTFKEPTSDRIKQIVYTTKKIGIVEAFRATLALEATEGFTKLTPMVLTSMVIDDSPNDTDDLFLWTEGRWSNIANASPSRVLEIAEFAKQHKAFGLIGHHFGTEETYHDLS